MAGLDFMKALPVLGQGTKAKAKYEIEPDVVTKRTRRDAKKANAKTFRDAVWARDKSRCRATGVQLSRSGTDPNAVGEVDHSIPRSLAPELIYDVSNGVLISRYLNRLRKAACAEAPEHRLFDYSPVDPGETDRGKPQRFVWRDRTGKITKERVG